LLTRHDLLTKQHTENKAKGLDDLEASALLIVQKWKLPQTPDIVSRAVGIATNLSDPRTVIGLLMFSERIGVGRAMRHEFETDPFFERHGCLYTTAAPLTAFARKHMNRLWDGKRVDPAAINDTAFAAYYATLIVPFTMDAWLMLAELRQRGVSLEKDSRDHVTEGIAKAHEFLANFPDADPVFRDLLTKGAEHLRAMKYKPNH
jgi:hypothetical protein